MKKLIHFLFVIFTLASFDNGNVRVQVEQDDVTGDYVKAIIVNNTDKGLTIKVNRLDKSGATYEQTFQPGTREIPFGRAASNRIRPYLNSMGKRDGINWEFMYPSEIK